MYSKLPFFLATTLLFCCFSSAIAEAPASPAQPTVTTGPTDQNLSAIAYLPERRKAQYSNSPGYAVFPYPYILPGIGSGLGLVGGAMNIADTYTDVYGIIFGGEIKGIAIGLADVHLIPKMLIFDGGYSNISKVQITSYSERGMHGKKNDFTLLDLNDAEHMGGRLTATFFKRRFELFAGWYQGAAQLKSIRDKEGEIILDAEDSPRDWARTTLVGTRLDLTDDFADPRRGVSLNISRFSSPPVDSGPDFYVMDYNLSAYIPMGKRSTWAFNYLRSDAVVSKKGETNPSNVQLLMGIDCSDVSLTIVESQHCLSVVNSAIANNTYGTATSLGGFSRLRSFSQSRYRGAHTQFFASEFRWNLTDEEMPYDIIIMKDVRTAMQLAFFYEMGSVADLRSNVGDDWAYTYGTGVRMITASGVVFRADLAYGSEGFAPQIFIGYPWEI